MHIRFDVLALLLTVVLGCVLAAYLVHQHPAAGPAVLTAIGEQCALPGGAHFCHGGVHTTSRGFGKYLSARVALLDPQVGVVHSGGEEPGDESDWAAVEQRETDTRNPVSDCENRKDIDIAEQEQRPRSDLPHHRLPLPLAAPRLLCARKSSVPPS